VNRFKTLITEAPPVMFLLLKKRDKPNQSGSWEICSLKYLTQKVISKIKEFEWCFSIPTTHHDYLGNVQAITSLVWALPQTNEIKLSGYETIEICYQLSSCCKCAAKVKKH